MDRDMEVDHAGDSENASCDIIASCPDATSIWSIYEDETKRSRSIIHKALTKVHHSSLFDHKPPLIGDPVG